MSTAMKVREWRASGTDGEYLVSSNVDIIDRGFIQKVFASQDAYWAWPLNDADMEVMLLRSTTLGLYQVMADLPPPITADSPSSPRTPSPTLKSSSDETLKQVGMARIVTDGVTTAYLTDVYVDPEVRSAGHGKWLMRCCDEIFNAMPAMRRTWLMTSPVIGKGFYSRELGMWDVAEESAKAVCMTRRFYNVD